METPETESVPEMVAETTPTSKAFKAPGFFPGVFEILFYIFFCVAISVCANHIKVEEDGFIISVAVTIVVSYIGIFVLQFRHKRRSKSYPDHSPVVRIRDLAILALIGTFAQFTEPLTSKIATHQSAAFVALGIGLVVICLYSKIWGALAGPKAPIWGAIFIIGGAYALYMAYLILDPTIAAVKAISGASEPIWPIMDALGPVFGIVGFILQSVAYIFGGLALLKEADNRGFEQGMLMSFFRYSVQFTSMSLFFNALQGAGFPDNPDAIEMVLGNSAFGISILLGLVAMAMTKHLHELKKASAA